jgi:hypothetical protein
MSKRWIRLWVNELLRSTALFELKDDEFGVFMKLLALAGSCRKDGYFAAGDNMPLPDAWMATTLNIPMPLFNRAKQRLFETNRIELNGNVLKIVNWERYQTEYDRQKPYREAKKEDPSKYTRGKYGKLVGK